MPQILQDNTGKKKRKRTAGVVVVLILAVLTVVGLGIFVLNQPGTEEQTAAVIAQARARSLKGDYKGAITVLEHQLGKARTDAEKVGLYLAVGAAYEGSGDVSAALAAYKNAQQLDSSYGTNYAVARLAEKNGDKALALQSYQAALSLAKQKGSKVTDSEIKRLEAAVVRTGGTQ